MNSLDELKRQIRKTIQESEEYKEYRELYDYISRNPDLKRQIDQFRKKILGFSIRMRLRMLSRQAWN